MNQYAKAITAFLTSAASMLAAFNVDVSVMTPEVLGSIGVIASTLLVYLIPNKEV